MIILDNRIRMDRRYRLIAAVETIPTAAVLNGVCYSGFELLGPTARKARLVWNFLSFYVTIILTFTYCHERILVTVHRQADVMAAHSCQGSNTAPDHSDKIQTSDRTMRYLI